MPITTKWLPFARLGASGAGAGKSISKLLECDGTWPPPFTLGGTPSGKTRACAVQGKAREECTCAKHRPVKPRGHEVAATTPKQGSGGKVGTCAHTKKTNFTSKTCQYKVTVGKDLPNFHHAIKADPTNDQSALTNRGIKH